MTKIDTQKYEIWKRLFWSVINNVIELYYLVLIQIVGSRSDTNTLITLELRYNTLQWNYSMTVWIRNIYSLAYCSQTTMWFFPQGLWVLFHFFLVNSCQVWIANVVGRNVKACESISVTVSTKVNGG